MIKKVVLILALIANICLGNEMSEAVGIKRIDFDMGLIKDLVEEAHKKGEKTVTIKFNNKITSNQARKLGVSFNEEDFSLFLKGKEVRVSWGNKKESSFGFIIFVMVCTMLGGLVGYYLL